MIVCVIFYNLVLGHDLRKEEGGGGRNIHTDIHKDVANYILNWSRGRFCEKGRIVTYRVSKFHKTLKFPYIYP